MGWDQEDVTPQQLQDYRKAAEYAWGDDTRHPDFIGHPNPSAGQCYVTSKWLTDKLGGYVGIKNGHYFWVSPDKTHIIDLTGDQNAYPPQDPGVSGLQVDDEDEPWEMEDEHKTWRPGPVIFKRANHPLYRDFRVKAHTPDSDRTRLFKQRANAALDRKISKTAEMTGDAYPGSEPQAEEDMRNKYMHDEAVNFDITPAPPKEYTFFYGNGQLHVSPIHDHDQLREHAQVPLDHAGPIGVGYATVTNGQVLWAVESNIALRGLVKVLKDYSKQVGWKWGGMIGADGAPVSEDFGPKETKYFHWDSDQNHLFVYNSHMRPWNQPVSGSITFEGKTARVFTVNKNPELKKALEEMAEDMNYRLAEYPGGTDMTERIKNKEHLMLDDLGDPEWEPEGAYDGDLKDLKCPHCNRQFNHFNELMLHTKQHEPMPEEEIQDGHFPQLDDRDDPLPLRRRNVNPSASPLSSYREASRVEGFDLYADLWGYNKDEGHVFYGGYLNGQLLGYGVVRPQGDETEVVMVYSSVPGKGIGEAIASKIKQHYPKLYTHADTEMGERLAQKMGFVNTNGQLYRYAAGSEPKDMIEAPVPFIYDIQKDTITTGHPGMRTSDIMGQFTPGGIVEGYYEPGGKVKVTTLTNVPYSTYHMLQLWYWTHPHMEITSLELEDQSGKKTKLAGVEIGTYLRQLAVTDPSVWNAYQALRKAGGKVYVVGGAVRDAMLQKTPKDLDLMVAGLPSDQVDQILKELPGKVDLTGKRFGVYRYKTKGHEVEIALPRQDTYSEDGRRGQGTINVDHNLPVEDDLLRRDFTVNSMAVDLDNGELIDPYGGADAIERRTLSTTHPSSFREDPTRLIRALVASSRHGLNPDENTRQEMADNAYRLGQESPDALRQQLDKLLASPNPAGAIRLAQQTGLLKYMIPPLANNFDFDQNNPNHNYTLGDHILNVLDNVSRISDDPDVRLAALLHDIGKPASAWTDPATGKNHYYQGEIDGKPVGADHDQVGADMAEKMLREIYNYPTAKMRKVTDLIRHHMFPAFSSTKGAKKFLNKTEPYSDDLLDLREADMTGKGQTPQQLAEKTNTATMRGLVEQARSAGEPTDQSALAINGNDLIAMGIKPGPQMGQILRQLTNDVVENPQLNSDREALLQRAQEYANSQP